MIREPRGGLFPDLARDNPEAYVQRLIEGVQANHVHTYAIWSALCQTNPRQPRLLELVADTWQGYSDATVIRVGALPLPENMRIRIFGGEYMSYDQEREYILSHEVAHRMLKQRERQGLGELGGALAQMRTTTGCGLSALGSIDFYRSETGADQASEDVTELVNMYLIDPEYLQAYLAFLQDSRYANIRAELGLGSIDDAQTAEYIFATIDNEVQDVLAPAARAGS